MASVYVTNRFNGERRLSMDGLTVEQAEAHAAALRPIYPLPEYLGKWTNWGQHEERDCWQGFDITVEPDAGDAGEARQEAEEERGRHCAFIGCNKMPEGRTRDQGIWFCEKHLKLQGTDVQWISPWQWAIVEYYGPTRPVEVAHFDRWEDAFNALQTWPRFRCTGLMVVSREE